MTHLRIFLIVRLSNAVQHCEKVYPFEPVYISYKSKPDSFNPEQKELREELSVFSQDFFIKDQKNKRANVLDH